MPIPAKLCLHAAALGGFIAIALPLHAETFDLSSEPLEQSQQPPARPLYGDYLVNMRHAEKPRFVTLIDTYHYARGSGLVTHGVLFSYHNRSARQVYFVADLPGFAPQPMRRNRYGVWFYYYIPPEIVHSTPTKKIRYKFRVDGIFTIDETHTQHEKDESGQLVSVFHLLHDHFATKSGVFVLDTAVDYGREVLFRIPAGEAETASVTGDFNRWNPRRDFMQKTEDGYFELRKVLPPGEYTFLYRIDGKLVQKVATPQSRTHPVYGRVNYLKVR
ncbi:MAG: hypothetical protein N2Z22_12005 [Turneriella sp.]|nr:hypothetical protein [Turneriella sp.]